MDIQMNAGEMSWRYTFVHVTRFHCMLIGAIGAILYFQNNQLFVKLANNFYLQLLCWIIIGLTAINKFHVMSFLDNEIISMITVFIIVGQIKKTNRVVNLDLRIFDFIGKISYGLYVIHPLVIFYLAKSIFLSDKTSTFNYVVVYVSVLLATTIVAYLSYQFFERRFLGLKQKYSTISSSETFHQTTN